MNKSYPMPKIHALPLTVARNSSRSALPSDHYPPGLGPQKKIIVPLQQSENGDSHCYTTNAMALLPNPPAQDSCVYN